MLLFFFAAALAAAFGVLVLPLLLRSLLLLLRCCSVAATFAAAFDSVSMYLYLLPQLLRCPTVCHCLLPKLSVFMRLAQSARANPRVL